jgi:hypothetical protein
MRGVRRGACACMCRACLCFTHPRVMRPATQAAAKKQVRLQQQLERREQLDQQVAQHAAAAQQATAAKASDLAAALADVSLFKAEQAAKAAAAQQAAAWLREERHKQVCRRWGGGAPAAVDGAACDAHSCDGASMGKARHSTCAHRPLACRSRQQRRPRRGSLPRRRARRPHCWPRWSGRRPRPRQLELPRQQVGDHGCGTRVLQPVHVYRIQLLLCTAAM